MLAYNWTLPTALRCVPVHCYEYRCATCVCDELHTLARPDQAALGAAQSRSGIALYYLSSHLTSQHDCLAAHRREDEHLKRCYNYIY